MAKKIFFFSVTLLVLVLIFLGAYNLVFKNNKNNPVADPGKKSFLSEEAENLFSGSGAAENPLNERVMGVTMGEDSMLYYYSLDDKSLKKATREGKNKAVLMSNLPGDATRVLWSAKKDKVLLSLKGSSGTLWHFVELGNKSLVPLKPEIGRLAWDNFGERTFYQYTDPATKVRSLNTSNPDGSNWKKLADLGAQDFFLSAVPGSSLVSFWNRPDVATPSTFETVGISGEARKALVSGTLYGGDYLWSPNGERAIGSASDNSTSEGFSLRLVDRAGSVKPLAIPTLVSKVVWSLDNRTLYYALPGGLPTDALLPNDYYQKPLRSKDTFWKIDLNTGKKSRVIELKESTQSLDATDLFLSPEEDQLYFTDRTSEKLYRFDL